MTNEEAIKTLKANYPDACYEQLREAVDTAIEALKAQQETRSADRRQSEWQAEFPKGQADDREERWFDD